MPFAKGRRNIKSIILFLVGTYNLEIGGSIGRTKLMKLLFLADYISLKEKRRKITGLRWIKWYYGPFSKKVLDVLDEMEDTGEIEVDHVECVGHFYSVLPDKLPLEEIDEETKEIIKYVVRNYGALPLPSLLEKIYSIKEVEEKEMGEVIL